MAIFNSIVLGKSKGSIGNVVTTTLKGQSVAKQRNYAPANPKSDLQVASRGKMSNAVLAWQFLSVFLMYINASKKAVESNYNAFVRVSKVLFQDVVADSRQAAAGYLVGSSILQMGLAEISNLASNMGGMTVTFATNGMAFNALTHVRAMGFDPITGLNHLADRLVTEAEWNAGSLQLAGLTNNVTVYTAYLYTSDLKSMSNVLFDSQV